MGLLVAKRGSIPAAWWGFGFGPGLLCLLFGRGRGLLIGLAGGLARLGGLLGFARLGGLSMRRRGGRNSGHVAVVVIRIRIGGRRRRRRSRRRHNHLLCFVFLLLTKFSFLKHLFGVPN